MFRICKNSRRACYTNRCRQKCIPGPWPIPWIRPCVFSLWLFYRLHHLAANLFRKRCIKFHRNRPSFIGDITKIFWSLFFWTQCSFVITYGVLKVGPGKRKFSERRLVSIVWKYKIAHNCSIKSANWANLHGILALGGTCTPEPPLATG